MHRLGEVGEQTSLLPLVEQVEQRPRLDVIVTAFALFIPVRASLSPPR
jgi:hypothetical protein